MQFKFGGTSISGNNTTVSRGNFLNVVSGLFRLVGCRILWARSQAVERLLNYPVKHNVYFEM